MKRSKDQPPSHLSISLPPACIYLTNTRWKAEPAPPITAVFSPLTRYRAWETLGVRHS